VKGTLKQGRGKVEGKVTAGRRKSIEVDMRANIERREKDLGERGGTKLHCRGLYGKKKGSRVNKGHINQKSRRDEEPETLGEDQDCLRGSKHE